MGKLPTGRYLLGAPAWRVPAVGSSLEAFLEEVALALRPRPGKRVVRGRGLGAAPDSVSRLPLRGTSGMGTGSRAPFLPGHVLVRGARVSRPRVAGRAVAAACAAGAGGSVTRRRAERAEPEGRGGAESSAEQPLPAAAADPGPGPRPGSMDRSSLLQLIQEQQLDPENTGFIGADTFTGLVHRHELPLDPAKLDMLVALAQSNERGQVCYQELADLIIVFLCYGARLNKWVLQTYHPEYMKSPLVYHPGHRARAWRFLTYMFMHVGLEQLGFNALLQLMIGVPLEMVHGLLRISLLYLAGVLAGSLTVSITDMRAPVVGGSGGVYALCSAHLANVVMNWAGMRCPYKLLRMVLALVCMSSEVGRAVWLRFSPPLPASGPQPSFMAHLAGAVVGVSMGLTILRSYEERLRDQCGWWVVLLAYGTFLLFAIFWNIFAYDLLGAHIPPPP
ncbi:rhomboid-related protein 1 isoform X4 [Bubalus bubalis]|uniref:rhomboid-related protein 1 isoform X4 n=1 Tax=Bubalus bubalis TaxID=89462 RepID=UPI001D115AD9|nr:rhomboid-related protein 1 isoform X4 [Bubalus bubalis]